MTHLARLEHEIFQLPLEEQLWLVERVSHRLRAPEMPPPDKMEQALAAMASDPAIVRELGAIDEEFASAEGDGLGEVS